jgi:hypothetical protein
MNVTLVLENGMWPAIQRHLLPNLAMYEEAAFVFATVEESAEATLLRAIEWYAVPPDGFEVQSPYFLQLTDETKAHVIKRAHDLEAALVEVHSHPVQTLAAFSPSDLAGFAEFVPHVRWRLKRRPYAAVVVANRTFDAFTWAGASAEAGPLHALVADGKDFHPTRATYVTSGGSYGSARSVRPQ